MKMEKSPNETEILSADEQKLREMCLSLKKIDAPADFDFKLKARIAGAKPSDFRPRFGFAFRYALPALALILVLGLLAYNGGFLSPGNNSTIAQSPDASQNPSVPQNNAISSLPPPQPENENPAVLPPNPSVLKVRDNEVAESRSKRPGAEKKREVKNDNFNGSTLESVKRAPVIQPEGFDQKNVPKNLQNIESSKPIPVKDVLSIMGIDAAFENGKWKVKSVTKNGVGESSDVRENDIIEAIDDQPLTGETVVDKSVKGKTMTVTRNGEKSQIKLQNKQ